MYDIVAVGWITSIPGNWRFWSPTLNNAQPAKIDLNQKSLPKQKTIQSFTIDAQGFRKTKNENPPMQEIEVTS